MAKIIVKKLFILAIPFVVLLSGFIVFDPFQIIYRYEDYSGKGYVIPNRDFISSEVYIKNREKYHYNSFIFGSSRTLAFETNDWKRYLNNDAHPFKFDASGETIFGIHSKIKYIDEQHNIIKYALLVFCSDVTFSADTDSKGHLLIKHPVVSKTSWVGFYKEFIKSYFNIQFLVSYYLYKITGDYYPFMQGYIEFRKIKYNTISNDAYILDQEAEYQKNPVEYYNKRKNIFYKRSNSYRCTEPSINSKQKIAMLREIKGIFEKHGTNYKIIISPLYDQLCFNKQDLLELQNIFGNNVYDYSGINEFTNSIYNYYEIAHYRPNVGEKIMQEIYRHP